jgi:hypothetical protein
MENLLNALEILSKYGKLSASVHPTKEMLMVGGIDPTQVSKADLDLLEDLGFFVGEEESPSFNSFRFPEVVCFLRYLNNT